MSEPIDTPPSNFPWPPVVYVSAVIGGFLLQYLFPLGWVPGVIGEMAFMLGLLFILGGVFILYQTFQLFKHFKTTIHPTKAASRLVTSGPFAISRNPIYLANTIITVGLGLVFSNAWFFLCGLVAAMAVTYLAIKPEERHLALRFGNAWHQYKRKVRRWF